MFVEKLIFKSRTIALLCLSALPGSCVYGQSTVIGQPSAVSSQIPSNQFARQNYSLNRFNPLQRKIRTSHPQPTDTMTSRLGQPTPESWMGARTMQSLILRMKESGFQVLLDESSSDNNLTDETEIQLPLAGESIDRNLRWVLREFSCDYSVSDDGVIEIYSDDALHDASVLQLRTYDIGPLTSDQDSAYDIVDLISETVDPDSWEMNGGNHRLALSTLGNGYLLTVVCGYQHQRVVSDLLEDILTLGSASRGLKIVPRTTDSRPNTFPGHGSTPVRLPSSSSNNNTRPSRSTPIRRGGFDGGIF